MKNKVLFILKDDGNEGSNNSAKLLKNVIAGVGNAQVTLTHLDDSVNSVFLRRQGKKVFLSHNRLRRKEKITSFFKMIKTWLKVVKFFKSINKRTIIINNAMLLDVVIASVLTKHRTFVFLRETHLPSVFIFLIGILSKIGLLSILSNNRSIIEQNKGFNISLINNVVTHEQALKIVPRQLNKIRILSVGAIYPLKNQIFALKLMKKLLLKYNVTLDLFGRVIDKEYYDSLTMFIRSNGLQDNVIFKGEVSNDKLISLYSEYDFYIQSSLSEGMSRSLMDAMLMGVYCIATDVGDTCYLLAENRGLLVSKEPSDNDIEDIFSHVSFLYIEDGIYNQSRVASQNYILDSYGSDTIFCQLVKSGVLE